MAFARFRFHPRPFPRPGRDVFCAPPTFEMDSGRGREPCYNAGPAKVTSTNAR
jgi:hypothetical protein